MMEWMRREDEYAAAHDPADAADRRVAGAPAPIDLREVFAQPWEGEATLWRPWWLRWLPAPARFRFRSEIANEASDSWDVIDTTTLPDGSVEVRRMRAQVLGPGRMRLTADDMPGGAEVRARSDGFDFTPYVIRTPIAGRLRVPLRYHDSVTLTDDGEMVDAIELRALGLRVARITMRLRRR
jgi:hypothetical protein